MADLPIQYAPLGAPVWAFFPELEGYRLVTRYMLPTGADIWSGDYGLVLTHKGPSCFRIVHEGSRAIIPDLTQ